MYLSSFVALALCLLKLKAYLYSLQIAAVRIACNSTVYLCVECAHNKLAMYTLYAQLEVFTFIAAI